VGRSSIVVIETARLRRSGVLNLKPVLPLIFQPFVLGTLFIFAGPRFPHVEVEGGVLRRFRAVLGLCQPLR